MGFDFLNNYCFVKSVFFYENCKDWSTYLYLACSSTIADFSTQHTASVFLRLVAKTIPILSIQVLRCTCRYGTAVLQKKLCEYDKLDMMVWLMFFHPWFGPNSRYRFFCLEKDFFLFEKLIETFFNFHFSCDIPIYNA